LEFDTLLRQISAFFTGLFGRNPSLSESRDISPKKNVTITTNQTLIWVAGSAGAYQLEAAEGIPQYTWSLYPGSTVPDGFNLSSGGNLSGYAQPLPPTVRFITLQIHVMVEDSDTPLSTDSKNITIMIVNPQAPTETPTLFTTFTSPTLIPTTLTLKPSTPTPTLTPVPTIQ
jgi:hypothetical protein